jgi:hypothetical protein
MQREGLRRNKVVDLLHRSGECLCGALAHRSEFKDIQGWFPLTAQEIHTYERLAEDNGHLENLWAGRLTVNRQQMRFDHPLCSSCEAVA